MVRTIRRARPEDIDTILRLIEIGRQIMRSDGNREQWPQGYPSRETIANDIAEGNSYLVFDDDMAVATFAFVKGPDATYRQIYEGKWLDDVRPYHVVHRIASLPDRKGIFREVMRYCFEHAGNIRIDTHRDNHIMQHVILGYGFTYCGIIHLLNGDERLAYQRLSGPIGQHE